VLDQDMTARDICDTLKRLRFRNGLQVIALGDKEASISPSRDPTAAMNGGRRFPPPWSVEEQEACFVVRDQDGQQLAYVYFRGRAGAAISGQAAQQRRGTADRGQHGEATGPDAAPNVMRFRL
jgi:hypothetical protein